MHVVVHIGPYKTGSTAIQNALGRGRKALRAHGILYYAAPPEPTRCLATLFASRQIVQDPGIRQKFPDLGEARAWSAACWDEFERAAAAPDVTLSVISSEFFSTLRDTPGFLARLQARFARITVVAYVRDPVELYMSSLQQGIRGGGTLRVLPTPLEHRYRYRRFLPVFAEAVGHENMIVRRFGRETLDGGDVVTDFFNRLRAFTAAPEAATVRANESLPGAVVAWLLLANETWDRKVSGPARRNVLLRLRSDPEIAALPKLRLRDGAFEQAIRARTRADCLWLNETFLQGQPPLPVAETDAMPDLDPEALRTIARVVTA